MLKIRLRRVGRKHDPSFRIVVTESTAPAKGKYLESVGFYNAHLKQKQIDKERATHWISKGAQPTDVVHNILVDEGVLDKSKIAVHKRSKKQNEEEQVSADVTTEAPAPDEVKGGATEGGEAESDATESNKAESSEAKSKSVEEKKDEASKPEPEEKQDEKQEAKKADDTTESSD